MAFGLYDVYEANLESDLGKTLSSLLLVLQPVARLL